MKFLVRVLPMSALLTPMLALAQFGPIDSFFDRIINFINGTLVPLVFAIAFLVFIWGVFQYFIQKSSEAKSEAKDLMLYGIGGFVIMVSVWGIVNLLAAGLGLSNTETIQRIPDVVDFNN